MPNMLTNAHSRPVDQTASTASLAGLLTVMQLSDSALPTGAFSHSFGMETYLQRGSINSAETYASWATSYLHQIAYTEGLAVRLTAEAAVQDDHQRITYLDHLLHASAIPKQIREAGTSMGQRMTTIVEMALTETPALRHYREAVERQECHGHPAVVFALATTAADVSVTEATAAYLMQLVTALTQNAIRSIPLGQNAGQSVLSQLRNIVPDVVALLFTLDDYDLGASAPGLEIAQMMHETQRARMFMS